MHTTFYTAKESDVNAMNKAVGWALSNNFIPIPTVTRSKAPNLSKEAPTYLRNIRDFKPRDDSEGWSLITEKGIIARVYLYEHKYPEFQFYSENPSVRAKIPESFNGDGEYIKRAYYNLSLALESSRLAEIDCDSEEAKDEFLNSLSDEAREVADCTLRIRIPRPGWKYLFQTERIYTNVTSGGYKDIEDLEIRFKGQVMVPPSVHPNGEEYSFWGSNTEIQPLPSEIENYIKDRERKRRSAESDFRREYSTVNTEDPRFEDSCKATEDLIAQYLPESHKHDFSLHLAGYLIRRIPNDVIEAIFENVWTSEYPEGVDDALNSVQNTLDNIEKGASVTGGNRLKEQFGEDSEYLLEGLNKIWGWSGSFGTFASSANGSSDRENTSFHEKYAEGNVADLLKVEFPKVKFAIDNFLPEGLCLLSAKPKHGKSLLTLDWMIATASGGVAMGCKRVEEAKVLGLLLEETPRRLQQRIADQTRGREVDLSGFEYRTKWPRVDEGGYEKLDQYLTDNPATSLVVIDTLKMWRSTKTSTKGLYDQEYESVEALRELAYQHNITIVVVHHNNKIADPEDPFDSISGSTGLIAVPNTLMVLHKIPNKPAVHCYVRSHDLPEDQKYALVYNPLTQSHNLDSNPEKYETSEERQEILECMSDGVIWTPTEVADDTGLEYENVKKLMGKMVKDEQLEKEGRGKYRIPTPSTTTTSSSREEENKGSKRTDPYGPYDPFTNTSSEDDKGKGTGTSTSGPFSMGHKNAANSNNLDPKEPKGSKGPVSGGPLCICGEGVTVRVTGEGVVEGLYCDECAGWLEGGETIIESLQSEEKV